MLSQPYKVVQVLHNIIEYRINHRRTYTNSYSLIAATSNASFYAANLTADDLDPTITLVKVTVLDQNDSPPTFAMSHYFAGQSTGSDHLLVAGWKSFLCTVNCEYEMANCGHAVDSF